MDVNLDNFLDSHLSEHFTLREMVNTRFGIARNLEDFTPSALNNLHLLCTCVLEPLRSAIGRPVKVSSGFRSRYVNDEVGGVKTSYHCKGMAADIEFIGKWSGIDFNRAVDFLKSLGICTEIISYRSLRGIEWIHVAFDSSPSNTKHYVGQKNLGTV